MFINLLYRIKSIKSIKSFSYSKWWVKNTPSNKIERRRAIKKFLDNCRK